MWDSHRKNLEDTMTLFDKRGMDSLPVEFKSDPEIAEAIKQYQKQRSFGALINIQALVFRQIIQEKKKGAR
jgi:hypothetical protein